MSKRKLSQDDEESSGDDWLLTYGDLMTQLVCFFVLVVAFSSINAAKFQDALVSIQIALGGGAASGVLSGMPTAIEDLPRSSKLNIDEGKFIELKGKVDKYIEEKDLSKYMETYMTQEGLLIRLKQHEPSVFFDSAEARIKEEAYPILNQIGKFISNLPNNIRVEGHTDNRAISTYQFPSNWELSTMRATNVLKYLNSYCQIAPERLSAAGYGPHRPIAENDTELGMSKNRRVEIIILKNIISSDNQNENVFGKKLLNNTN